MLEHDLAALSDPAKDQYFLTNPAKLQFILDAAGIRETDTVVEIGAGAGTVARMLPKCARLTLIELDERLIPALRCNAPHYATILNADGIAFLTEDQPRIDVVLGNLPTKVAADLAELLPKLDFRVAVVATGCTEPFDAVSNSLEYSVLTSIEGNDFTPPQPGTSYLVCARRRLKTSSLHLPAC